MSHTGLQAIRAAFVDFAGTVADPEQMMQQFRYLPDGLLLTEGGKIISLTPWQETTVLPENCIFNDFRGQLIMPGFIDTHIHYPQTEMIAACGEQLLEWLEQYTFPVESKYGDPEYAAKMAAFFIRQLFSNGTTTALVFASVHPQSVDALFSEAEKYAMRLIAGKVMMDRHAPQSLLETPEQSAEQSRALIERWHGKGRLGYAITPRFAPTSSAELLQQAGALRNQYPDVWMQTHLSENLREVEWVRELFPQQDSYLGVYHHFGLTGKRSVFAHCIHLQDKEWDCLQQTGSAIAFCPTSNLFLGSGLFPLDRARAQHIPVGMGTDVGAGTSFSLLCTLGDAYKVQQLQNNRLNACEAFYHATLGGAHALDLHHQTGNFNAGNDADFIVIDMAATPLQALRQRNSKDIIEQLFVLMTLGDERNIAQTWVNGQCVWQQGTTEALAIP
ncbi:MULTISPECIES: guanine deaminase [Tatumella]|uniref:Guanine deaminase n=1 Tax=Tatumella punctata TaxID=399969 RepID=A0ABW1VKT2_9GAMM|nr:MULTISPECIES: guanine deaminase [unclassified Tatumella]MBS0856464.1 guanine deaminase [Tatumella sp. JGM16]MBS0911464.1 guanine deaminase [Tatumella sp. JGM91]